MTLNKLVLATQNKDKIREIRTLLAPFDVSLIVPAEKIKVVEDRNTLEGNAIKKAGETAEQYGMPALADDTGLEVDALDGAPGVHSARYAGENASYDENVDKLLHQLESVPAEKRGARFRTVVALVVDDKIYTTEGICKGVILKTRRGTGGFGYDPVFYIPERGVTLAEMTLEEKNQISHRGVALLKMKKVIQEQFGA